MSSLTKQRKPNQESARLIGTLPACIGSLCLVAFCLVAATANAQQDDRDTLFESDIRPLLARRCYGCHGRLDEPKGGLRLTSREAILAGGDSGPAAFVGDAAASRLIQAIRHQDLEMPPKKKMPQMEIDLLTKWIDEGMHWPAETHPRGADDFITHEDRRFWSFQEIIDVPPPDVLDQAWPLTNVDRFVLAELEERGIKPNPLADRRTLIRRATLDLIGLPPTLDEIHDFVNDQSTDAFARVVDRLLESRHYGERWGRHWLDVVRYADTAGDGADYPIREAYKYRNYVIDAFNRDMPYDQFLREQIAGDILARQAPDGSRFADQTIASGYIAISKRFGYNINKEFHHLDIADTLETLGRSILGLSIGCARCHDHKYDPVSSADYYALYGIFDSSRYAFPGGEEYKRPHDLVPLIPPEKVAMLESERQARIDQIDATMHELGNQRSSALLQQNLNFFPDVGFESQAVDARPGTPWLSAGPNLVLADSQSPFKHVNPLGTRGLRIENGQPNDGLRQEFATTLTAQNTAQLQFNLDFRNMQSKDGTAGSYRFFLGQGAITSMAIELSVGRSAFSVRNGDAFDEICPLREDVWYNVQLILDMKNKTFSGTLYDGQMTVEFSNKMMHPAWNGSIDTFFTDGLGTNAGPRPTHDIDNLVLQATPLLAPGQTATQTPEAAEQSAVERAAANAEIQRIDEQLVELKKQRDAVAAEVLYEVAYAIGEGEAHDVQIQERGEPTQLGERVQRRFLEILGADPLPLDDAGSGRLQLANWLTRPSNPLTPRVMVNRIWQHHFGTGIVESSSDFGLRGQPPTHPELLDFLASRFIEDGWSIKATHRRLMLSRVYQLSSRTQDQAEATDPENRWLWRFSRRRLDAESMRDAMLALSGNLDPSIGQEHPFPPVDQWGFTIHNPFHAVYPSNQRSIYLMTQRSRKHPYLSLFDAADNNISTASRMTTTTPTQALYLMNDPFVHEQSLAIAGKWLKATVRQSQRIELAYESIVGRQPDDDQRKWATDFLMQYERQVAGLGESPDQQALMAHAALARVLLTSNEFLFLE